MTTVARTAWQAVANDDDPVWDEVVCFVCHTFNDQALRIVCAMGRVRICTKCADMIRAEG